MAQENVAALSSNQSEGGTTNNNANDEQNALDWQETRGIELFQQAMFKKLQIEEEDSIL